jgi:hypothetical protein
MNGVFRNEMPRSRHIALQTTLHSHENFTLYGRTITRKLTKRLLDCAIVTDSDGYVRVTEVSGNAPNRAVPKTCRMNPKQSFNGMATSKMK